MNTLSTCSTLDMRKAIIRSKIVIDIRTPDEWQSTGVIKGAVLMTVPMAMTTDSSVIKNVMSEITDKHADLMLYCASSRRSLSLGTFLAEQGFSNVYHLLGGLPSWQADGLPLVPYNPK